MHLHCLPQQQKLSEFHAELKTAHQHTMSWTFACSVRWVGGLEATNTVRGARTLSNREHPSFCAATRQTHTHEHMHSCEQMYTYMFFTSVNIGNNQTKKTE